MSSLVPDERVEQKILFIRGEKVLLDNDLAELYGVSTKNVNKAVKRNPDRFPEDFVFQLSDQEYEALRFQNGTSKEKGGRRYLPAALVNVAIMRTFVKLRKMVASNKDLAQKLTQLEKKYDQQFRVVFDAIRQLMEPSVLKPSRRIGF